MYRDVRSLLDEYSAEQPRVLIGEIHDFDLVKLGALLRRERR